MSPVCLYLPVMFVLVVTALGSDGKEVSFDRVVYYVLIFVCSVLCFCGPRREAGDV